MKSRTSFFKTSIFLFFISGIQAQDIQLTYKNTSRTIKAGTFIEVNIPVPNREPCSICPSESFGGKILSYQNGFLKLEVHHSLELILEGDVIIGTTHKNYDSEDKIYPVMEIPHGRILSITIKGKNRLHDYSTGDVVAMTLGILAIGHLTAVPFAGDNKDFLLALWGTEVVVAGILGSVSKQKTFVTHEHCPMKPDQSKKLWFLE